jgi:CheY-like chemotaxis protein
VLEAEGWDVCGEAATGREAVVMTASHRPDIVILDLSMPELNGLEAAREISERFPQIDIYILTMHAADLIPEIPGVRAWVMKTDLHLLIDGVRSARPVDRLTPG